MQEEPEQRRRTVRRHKAALSIEEVRAAIDNTRFPPILDVKQAAVLLGLSVHTMYRVAGDSRYREAVRRGKPLRFWRDRLILAFFAS